MVVVTEDRTGSNDWAIFHFFFFCLIILAYDAHVSQQSIAFRACISFAFSAECTYEENGFVVRRKCRGGSWVVVEINQLNSLFTSWQ